MLGKNLSPLSLLKFYVQPDFSGTVSHFGLTQKKSELREQSTEEPEGQTKSEEKSPEG